MELSLRTKARVTGILAVGAALFGWLGWPMAAPADPEGALTILYGGSGLRVVVAGVVLGLGATAVGVLIGGRKQGWLGALAIPAGLTAWSVRGGTIGPLLLAHHESVSRSAMFHRLALEAVLWFALVGMGWMAAQWFWGLLCRRVPGKAVAEEGAEAVVSDEVKAAGGVLGLGRVGFNGVFGLLLTAVGSVVIVRLLAQSGSTVLASGSGAGLRVSRFPELGQALLAVGGAFFLSTMLGYQVFSGRVGYFAGLPVVVAVFAYVMAGQMGVLAPLEGAAWPFMASSVTYGAILPVQYVGVGCLGVAGGYWYGMKWRAQLQARREAKS